MSRLPQPWYRKDRKSWFVTIDGHRHNLGPNQKQAFTLFHRLMAAPRHRSTCGDSLISLIERFLDYTEKHRSPCTYRWYRDRLELFAKRYPGLTASTLLPFHVQDWIDSMDGISNGTRRNYVRSIQRCMKWCEEMGLIDRSPIAHFKKPRGGRREVVISPDDWQRLLESTTDQAFRELLQFHHETGCRPQESLRMEARHVDLGNSRVVFPGSESKSGLPRIVYLTDAAKAIITRLAKCHATGLLFRNSDGEPWQTSAVNNAFTRIQIRWGIEQMKERGIELSETEIRAFTETLNVRRRQRGRWTAKSPSELREEARRKLRYLKAKEFAPKFCLYHIRHTWMNRLLISGVDALTVAILAGHSDVSTLARSYQHLSQSPSFLLSQAKRLEAG